MFFGVAYSKGDAAGNCMGGQGVSHLLAHASQPSQEPALSLWHIAAKILAIARFGADLFSVLGVVDSLKGAIKNVSTLKCVQTQKVETRKTVRKLVLSSNVKL